MKRFRHPLLVIDGRDGESAAIAHAMRLAQNTGRCLDVLGVVEAPRPPPAGALSEVWANIVAMIEEALATRVDAIVDEARAAGLEVTGTMRLGRLAQTVVEHVAEHEHDLIIRTGARRQSERVASVYGADDRELQRSAPVPLWLVPRGAPAQLGRVLVGIGPLDADVRPFSVRMLQTASGLAAVLGAQLVVVHAWDLFDATLQHSYEALAERTLNELRVHLERVCHTEVAALVAHVVPAGVETQIVIGEGAPADVLHRVVGEQGSDLLVLGAVSQPCQNTRRMGRTAVEALDGPPSALLTLKADAFVRAAAGCAIPFLR